QHETASICYPQTYSFNGSILDKPGIYTATYPGVNGCDSIYSLNLNIHRNPVIQIDLGTKYRYCTGDTITLNLSGGAAQYTFDPTPLSYLQNSASFVLDNSENNIRIYGTDDNNCKAEKSVLILVEYCCETGIPNAFSPNGDGLNDEFRVVTP